MHVRLVVEKKDSNKIIHRDIIAQITINKSWKLYTAVSSGSLTAKAIKNRSFRVRVILGLVDLRC